MRIRYDVTPAAATVYCECGWRELTLHGRDRAQQLAAEHERRVHPGDRNVRDAARIQQTRRRLQGSSDVRTGEDHGGHDPG